MLSHLDARNQPSMVDVGAKSPTDRMAHAQAIVWLPPELARLIQDGDITGKKGPIFQTARLAGIMGTKRTSDLIPLCHPLAIDHAQVDIALRPVAADGSAEVEVHCRVSTHSKTGVEMEALTGASVAALTLYDMGKAVTHQIAIREIRLLEKTGGKRDFHAGPAS